MTTPVDPTVTLRVLLSDLNIATILRERAETASDRHRAITHDQQVLALREKIVDLFVGIRRS